MGGERGARYIPDGNVGRGSMCVRIPPSAQCSSVDLNGVSSLRRQSHPTNGQISLTAAGASGSSLQPVDTDDQRLSSVIEEKLGWITGPTGRCLR
jgi:hypothetical protein